MQPSTPSDSIRAGGPNSNDLRAPERNNDGPASTLRRLCGRLRADLRRQRLDSSGGQLRRRRNLCRRGNSVRLFDSRARRHLPRDPEVDRRFRPTIRFTGHHTSGAPVVEGNRVVFSGTGLYEKDGVDTLTIELSETAEFDEAGRIVSLVDIYAPGQDEMFDWLERHGADFDASYASYASYACVHSGVKTYSSFISSGSPKKTA
jgi:hypothetical protein